MKKFALLCFAMLVSGFANSFFAQNANVELRSTIQFPGQTLANICGWTSPDGQEYALIGASKGLVITNITDPDAPLQVVQIPGPDNLWKEIKTYKNFAYVTSEGGQSLQIVDLSKLPSANLDFHHYLGDGAIAGGINKIHALHIDTTLGFIYLFGGTANGAVICDIHTDPYNPKYVGIYNQGGYVHDGFADNDTLYAGHIYDGFMTIVDMKDKANPKVLGSVKTPLAFTHNIWLTDDHKSALTTDERDGSYLTSYDVRDPEDIIELDRLQTTPGSGSIVHNTHIYNDWAISSWYTDGFNIVDAHRPINLVQTARFDTWPGGSGGGFDGCWGVFPYFKSGTIIASNIEGEAELFVFTPTYVRAAYLEGKITDGCSGAALSGVSVKINGGDQLEPKLSKINGNFYTGQTQTGNFTATFSKAGYQDVVKNITLATAEIFNVDVVMGGDAFSIFGSVVDETTNLPLPNAPIAISGNGKTYNLQTNGTGEFTLDCVLSGDYSASAGQWGYKISQNIKVNANQTITIKVGKGYYDDFALDYGWTNSATSATGIWVIGEPVGTNNQGSLANPDLDSDVDGNDQCYMTGNGGGSAGTDDVDNGNAVLTTPIMELAGFGNAELTFDYWFFNGGGSGTPNDNFKVEVTNGTETKTLFTETAPLSNWRKSPTFLLGDFVSLTNKMQIIFTATDDQPGHVVEAAVDVFEVKPIVLSAKNLDKNASLDIFPNPTAGGFQVKYQFDGSQNLRLRATNLTGQIILDKNLADEKGQIFLGENWQPGVYFLFLENENAASRAVRLVKN